MKDVLQSGKATFKIEVPFKLVETGSEGTKPLIVYLHGFRQHLDHFQKMVKSMTDLEAYHLFIQGPYPLYDRSRKKKVEEWGRAWYLYDGRQDQFVKSMERSSEFIQKIIDTLLPQLKVSRICIFGYSMGGYLAGYFALSRWKHVNELIVIGCRIKTEVFENRELGVEHLNVLALHGKGDKSVKPDPQKESTATLRSWGANVMFEELDTGHRLTESYLSRSREWLVSLGYHPADK